MPETPKASMFNQTHSLLVSIKSIAKAFPFYIILRIYNIFFVVVCKECFVN